MADQDNNQDKMEIEEHLEVEVETPELPQHLQNYLKKLIGEFARQDEYARRFEVYKTAQRHLYARGSQQIVWDNNQGLYVQIGANSEPIGNSGTYSSDVDMPRYTEVYNIYTPFMEALESVLTQNAPSIRFEAQDLSSPHDIAASKAYDSAKRHIERSGYMVELQRAVANHYSNDSRSVVHVCWDDKKNLPKFDAYGSLESKVPLLMDKMEDFPFVILSREYEDTMVRGEYPDVKGVQGGPNSLEGEYERMNRIIVKQGVTSRKITGDSFVHLVTVHKCWLRPQAWSKAPDDIKTELNEAFPDGCFIKFLGDTYAESRNESMDDHICISHPRKTDGQITMPLMEPMVTLQDSFNDLQNMSMEIFDYCIPFSYMEMGMIDPDALQDQTSEPGNHIPLQVPTGKSLAQCLYQEPPAQVPMELIQFKNEIVGALGQFITGALPALFGGTQGGSETASEYNMAREQAMGRIGIYWQAMQRLWAEALKVAIILLSKNVDKDIEVPGKTKGGVSTKLKIDDLQGNVHVYPDSDTAFPETWAARRQTLQQMLSEMTGAPWAAEIIQQPDNQVLIQNLNGLEDLVIPGAEDRNKQAIEIEELIAGEPIINPQALQQLVAQQQQNGLPVTSDMLTIDKLPDSVLQPSVAIDEEIDNHQAEWLKCQEFLNSIEGQKIKRNLPQAFRNVRLHALAHKALVDKATTPALPPIKESLSIAFKDLPGDAQQQLLGSMGINVSSESVATLPPAVDQALKHAKKLA